MSFKNSLRRAFPDLEEDPFLEQQLPEDGVRHPPRPPPPELSGQQTILSGETGVLVLTRTDPPARVEIDTPEKVHIKNDLDVANDMLQIIHQSWGAVSSIKDVGTLVDKTFVAIEGRRKVLNRQYGYQGDGSKGSKIQPLD